MSNALSATGIRELTVAIAAANGSDKRLLAREPLTPQDLILARDTTWFQGMRAGLLGEDLSALSLRILPGETHEDNHLAGYVVELSNAGRSFRRLFPLESLAQVSQRAVARLLEQGALHLNDTYAYYLTNAPQDADDTDLESPHRETRPPTANGRVLHRIIPPVLEQAHLARYLDASHPLPGASAPPEEEEDRSAPVFISPEVWEEGHQLARRGGEDESAAVWVGRLMRDLASPEIFLVVDACLEAEHAAEEQFAVSFTGATWSRVRELLEVRRRRLQRPHERILGSVHGHNFRVPADAEGRRQCSACATASVCSRTTAVASIADLEWHRSVFAGQPWALLLIWGHNARDQEDWRLYGLADALLAPRTIRLLKS